MAMRTKGRIGLALVLIAAAGKASAQTAPLLSHEFPMPLDSGFVQNGGAAAKDQAATRVYWNEVRVFGAPWLRLSFDDVVLSGVPEAGNGSYLIITSLRDNARQRLDANSIREWSNTSAYFNGDAVRIELFAYPRTGLNLLRMSHVTGGLFENQAGPDTVCGTIDNRTLSTYPAQGRIYPIGCTGWLINTSGCANRFLSAGHCFPTGVGQQVVEFNVPLSTSTGGLVHPPPEHQYAVDMGTVQRVQTVIGNDWSQFFTAANSNTGLHARQMQGGAAYSIGSAPAVAGQTLRVTGYGTTDPNDPTTGGGLPLTQTQVQKTHTGAYTLLSGTRMEYTVDTTGGNSGSPIVNGTSPSDVAIGIHTNAGCTTTGGANSGTAIQNAGLQAAIAAPTGTCSPYVAPTCLQTLFASNNGGSAGGAVYFDIAVAPGADILVTNLYQNVAGPGGSFNVAVYLTPSTHVGKELTPGLWTLVATGSGAAEAENTPSLVALSNRFTLQDGQSYGVAIVCNGLGHEYTDGTGTNEVYNDANLTMTFGRASNVAFTSPLITGERVWNGRFCYNRVGTLIIDSGPLATNSSFSTGNYVAGTEFTLSQPTTIRSLGWLDVEGDGLTSVHRIGVWSAATQSLLMSTSVGPLSASVGSLHNGTTRWVMGRVQDTVLPAGTYRIAGEVSGDSVALLDDRIPGPNTTLSAGYYRTDFPSGGFAYPNLNFGTNNVRVTLSTQPVTDLLVDAGPASTQSTFSTGNYVAGTEFTVSAPTTVRSLGWLDAEGDGLAVSHQIGLWSVATQALLTSGTATPSSQVIVSANGTGKWFMASVPAVTLSPGTYRVAGMVNGDNIALINDKLPGPNTTLTAGYVRTDFPSGGFAYPNLTFTAEAVRATACTRAVTAPPTCYANCDGSTIAPILNVNDFTCFLNKYAASDPYANCDASTIAPVLNVNDFTCFLNKYAAGCP